MRQAIFIIFALFILSGCRTTGGNVGSLQNYAAPASEADWIRNGDGLRFEGEDWFPVDSIESLQDSEVAVMGEYKGVTFFTDKVDVRPFNRLYTKFSRNRFRIFEKRVIDD